MSLDYDWLSQVKTVHIIGAGLNQDKPAHRAFIDAGHRGFRMVPVHPKAAGSSILGRPIVPHPWSTSNPELFVVFLVKILLHPYQLLTELFYLFVLTFL
mgnify:CR=1 FL=1